MSALAAAPPRDNLFRALPPAIDLVRSSDATMPTMVGHFAIFNEWAEVDSVFEGHFMERFAPGSMAKTFRENRARIRCIFRHGLDPQIGDKVLGPVAVLGEDDTGAAYEVPLFDTSYNRDLLPALEAGQYGTSFRFRVMKEDFVMRPKRSEHNPEGLPERTVTEAFVREFGPCTFPTYQGATAGLRSVTDDFIREHDEETLRGNATASFSASLARPTMVMTDEEERESRLYSRTLERIGEIAWAMHPDMIATVVAIVAERASGKRLTDEEIRARIGLREDQPVEPSSSPVAELRLRGPIVPHAGMVDATSSKLASVEELRGQFRDALTSEDTKAILFNIDSPGGDASLIPEFASEIRAARGQKPIVAVANTYAASAAYWLASAADEVVVTPSGKVGSIGVWSAHDDLSGMQEKLGVKTTLISAGKYKVETNPYEPLSDEAKAYIQSHVDEFYAMFVQAVADGRGVDADKVASGFGQGRMVMANQALKAKMVDRVATYDETLQRLTKKFAAPKSRVSTSTESEPSAATTPDKTTPEPPGATTRSHARTGRAGSLTHGAKRRENRLP